MTPLLYSVHSILSLKYYSFFLKKKKYFLHNFFKAIVQFLGFQILALLVLKKK